MIKAANSKIVVSANMDQKEFIHLNGVELRMANLFENNYREKSPVVCTVVQGNEHVYPGDVLIVHHNTLYQPSPYYLQDDLFAIPFAKTIFAKLSNEGDLIPVCGNIICDRPVIETNLPLPPEHQKKHIDRVIVIDGGDTGYRLNQLLFIRPHAYYEIVYHYGGIRKRVHKVHDSMVIGVVG